MLIDPSRGGFKWKTLNGQVVASENFFPVHSTMVLSSTAHPFLPPLLLSLLSFLYETGSYVAQVVLKFTMYSEHEPELVILQPPLPNAKILGV